MDYSDPDAFTLSYQLTKNVRRDVRSKQSKLIRLVYGTQTPYVLRQNHYRGSSDPEKAYELVAECYLHGMMDSEALQVESHEEPFIIK
jgi:hypothetical protein